MPPARARALKALPGDSTTPTGRIRSPRMVERTANTRALILWSAARIIGRYGYAGCSIARVAAKAKIAHGTFYLYFPSQQALFDELLPAMQDELLNVISAAVRDAGDVYELEERGLRANFAYLKKHPFLYRVTYEAEVFSPIAFEQHFIRINRRYSRALRRIIFGGATIEKEQLDQLDAVAAMLEGARTRLLMRFGLENQKIVGLPDEIMATYLSFVKGGIEALFGEALAHRQAKDPQAA